MIKEAFGKGATTEAAIEAAKSELGAPWDADVQIEVLKTAKKKTAISKKTRQQSFFVV